MALLPDIHPYRHALEAQLASPDHAERLPLHRPGGSQNPLLRPDLFAVAAVRVV